MPIDASILSEVEHLRELTTEEKTALAEKMDLLRYSTGQIIFRAGDPGNAMYIVRSGEVEIYVQNDQGEKIVLETSQSGDIFGEVSLLDGGARTATVVALDEVVLLRLDRKHFEAYVRQYPPAALNLLSVAARRLRRSDDLIRRTTVRNANDVAAEQGTMLTRLADAVPAFVGNLGSVALHILILGGWVAINVSLIQNLKAFDPYPFEFLSVIVSLEAIFLTLFVLTSQNRQRTRDRIRSDIEFESSLNTETKIAFLHEKIDKIAETQYALMVNTQKLLEGSGRG